MTYCNRIVRMIALSLLSTAAAAPAFAEQSPIVVELFTSQGCSSCPPANENLIKISNRPGVLALSFSVTYWDYLGWKDTYGMPEFTERQVAYEPALGQPGPYTPQMVVNGRATIVGNRLSQVEALVAAARPMKGPALLLKGNRVQIGSSDSTSPADIWLVRYDPKIESLPVARGENGGSNLRHTHIVRQLHRLGTWDGGKISIGLPISEPGLKTAVLVQEPNGGQILAAVTE